MTTMTATTTTAPTTAIPAQRTRRSRRTALGALATPWSDAQLPDPRRLPRATDYPPLALVELARLR